MLAISFELTQIIYINILPYYSIGFIFEIFFSYIALLRNNIHVKNKVSVEEIVAFWDCI